MRLTGHWTSIETTTSFHWILKCSCVENKKPSWPNFTTVLTITDDDDDADDDLRPYTQQSEAQFL